MTVIFLDFDGVLNSTTWVFGPDRADVTEVQGGHYGLDPAAVAVLDDIVARSGAAVVVSSSWRVIHSLDELRRFLFDAGFRGPVIGVTPRYRTPDETWLSGRYGCRGDEIAAWLADHSEVARFVILDDSDDMGPLMDRLVRIDGGVGLRTEDVGRVLAMLERPLEKVA